MKICPNLSDPAVRERWEALENDPDLGRVEAMREFISAERNNRPIGTVDEVKARLAEQFEAPSAEEMQARYDRDHKILLEKSNDPLYTDPESLMGLAILSMPEVRGIANNTSSNTRAMEILKKFSDQTGINYAFVTPEQAIELTANAKNPYNITKGPAFFYGDTVYFIGNALTSELAFHEISHPVVRSLQISNPALFQKLYKTALAEDPSLLDAAINEYADFKEALEKETDVELREQLRQSYTDKVAEEVLVQALTKASLKKDSLQSKGFAKLISDIMYALKQLMRKIFGQKIDISKLDVNTTLDQFAEMLVAGGNFEINTDIVSQKDIVSYYDTTIDYLNELKNIHQKGNNKVLLTLTRELHQKAVDQIRLLLTNKNYKDLALLFVDEYGRGDLQEIRSSISKYTEKDLTERAEDLIAELEKTEDNIQSLLNSLIQLDLMMDKMKKSLEQIEKDTYSNKDPEVHKENVHKAFYYTNYLNHWQQYIKDALQTVEGISPPGSPINNLLNKINNTMNLSAKSIVKIQYEGVGDVLFEKWQDMAERAEEIFKENIETLEKKKLSKNIIDRQYVEFYGMPRAEYELYQKLKNQASLTIEEEDQLERLEEATDKGLHLTRSKINKALSGKLEDAGYLNSYAEGYLYNSDPVIGGFAMYYRDNITEMEARVQARENEILKRLGPLLQDADIKSLHIGELGKLIGFVDEMGSLKDGAIVSKEVWTLLNPYKGYRLEIDKLNEAVKKAQIRYTRTGNPDDKKALIEAVTTRSQHERKWMNQEYVEDFYTKNELLEKDDIGRQALYERGKILDSINVLDERLKTADDVEASKILEEMDLEWDKYKQLHSTYYLNGNKKTDSFTDEDGEVIVTNDLAIALRLKEHKEHVRKFYDWKPRPGVFQSAYKRYEEKVHIRLTKEKLQDPDVFKERFKQEMDLWLAENTRTVIKQTYYEKRAELYEELKAILADLPSTLANAIDTSELYKTIWDLSQGYRDDDGQPNGSEVSEGRKEKIKAAQEAIEKAKGAWAGLSGLTTAEMDELSELTKLRTEEGGRFKDTKNYTKWILLIQRKNDLGLSPAQSADVSRIFEELAELSYKEPTTYYMETINHLLEGIDTDALFKKHAITSLNVKNIDILYEQDFLNELFSKSPEFQNWFEKNHIKKKKFIKDEEGGGEKVDSYERLYIWNVIKPVDPSYYESTKVTRRDGVTIPVPGVPKLKYYARVVKPEFKTKKIVGETIDNHGRFLPKQVAGSPYLNEEYFKLKNAAPGTKEAKYFKVLQVITEEHLKNQEGLGKRGKLYLDFPRFEKNNEELLRSGLIPQKTKEAGNAIAEIFARIKEWFKGAKADYGTEFNWKDEKMLVRIDAFNDEVENIPIQGIYDLTPERTSTNIVHSMFRYMLSAENNKQLVKMNPMATAIKNILEANPQQDLNKRSLQDYVNLGVLKPLLKKKDKYIRKQAFNNFYDREFLGKTKEGFASDTPWLMNLQKTLFKGASFSFFALNIPSDLKNAFGAKFQALVHSAAGKDLTPATLVKGEGWAFKYMKELSMDQAYVIGQKDLNHQLADIFDPDQGRFQEKIGENITRTLTQDVVGLKWTSSFRRWSQLEATMQTFAGMMYKKKVKMGNEDIDYMNAWELNADGKIQLKKGIDPKYGITYDSDGNMLVGSEFKKFKRRIHAVMRKLNGAYAKLDQPDLQRHWAFRWVSFLRRYFTTMAVNRFSKKRWNPGYEEIDQGFYVRGTKALLNIARDRTFQAMNSEDKQAIMRMTAEIGTLMMINLIIGLLWEWDDDDEDRYAKLRETSGHMGLLGLTSENREGEEFNIRGFMSLHALNLMMQIRAENEQMVPLPGFGLGHAKELLNIKSIAFGPTVDTYGKISTEIANIFTGSDKAFYKRRSGPYEWQDEGGRKLWANVAKMFGFTGGTIDPAQYITNFTKSQVRYK